MKAFRFMLTAVIVAAIAGCSTSSESDLEFYLFGSYTNTNGDNPQFIVDYANSDSLIHFDGNVEYTVLSPDILLRFNNISIFSPEENYHIDAVEVEEKVDDKWVWYPEFDVNFGNLTQLGVVLVLDVSNSLGDDFDDVQEYAVEFLQIVLENSPEVEIGIVSFSYEIDVFPPTSDLEELVTYIYSLEKGNYTRMYDAMQEGITLLENLEVNGKALVTFTDGLDNYSNITPEELVTQLADLEIRSYTMGLEGNGAINTDILEQLAVNGCYRLTSSKNDLRSVFQFFAESVSNVYAVTYQRNNQEIEASRRIRFKFIDEN